MGLNFQCNDVLQNNNLQGRISFLTRDVESKSIQERQKNSQSWKSLEKAEKLNLICKIRFWVKKHPIRGDPESLFRRVRSESQ